MSQQDHELAWLIELMRLPTAAGREQRVCEWIERWVRERPDLALTRDQAGNLVVRFHEAGTAGSARPLYITAHLDHPAFVVERVIGPGTLMCSFRGGVLDAYFVGARVEVFSMVGAAGARPAARGVITERTKKEPFAECLIELEGSGSPSERIQPGDVACWAVPGPRVEGDLFHGSACDDLSAVAAAVAVMERLRARPADEVGHVRLLFTRAEEIGFIGAIAACKLGTMEKGARIIALENSRSFDDSPIGGGPIVRVGDRISVFSATLTGAVSKVAEKLNGTSPLAWQRKLMAGGACEASVFQAYGYDATCVCLPLGNYHNMENLAAVQAGDASAARIAPEIISVSDYKGMIALLEACALELEEVEPLIARMEKLYVEKGFVLR